MPALDPSASSSEGPLTRLPGRAARIRVDGSPGGTLWLGTHHLLQVQAGMLREGYRRFAYRDIQSIGVRRTVRGLVYNVILGLMGVSAALLIVWLLSAGSPGAPLIGGMVIGVGALAVVLGLLVVNFFRGPTVRADLRTAVGLYPLPSLSRMKPARRALELIRQRVDATQGSLSTETLAASVARLAQPPPVAAPPGGVQVLS